LHGPEPGNPELCLQPRFLRENRPQCRAPDHLAPPHASLQRFERDGVSALQPGSLARLQPAAGQETLVGRPLRPSRCSGPAADRRSLFGAPNPRKPRAPGPRRAVKVDAGPPRSSRNAPDTAVLGAARPVRPEATERDRPEDGPAVALLELLGNAGRHRAGPSGSRFLLPEHTKKKKKKPSRGSIRGTPITGPTQKPR